MPTIAPLRPRPTGRWLHTSEVAVRLGVCEETVRRLIRCGEMPASKAGPRSRTWLVSERELDDWLAEHAAVGLVVRALDLDE